MKHLLWLLMSIVLSFYILTGCATTRGPSELTPEVRKEINRVSISPELVAPECPVFPVRGGILKQVIQVQRNHRLRERLTANYDPQKVMTNVFREVFAERISQSEVFELVDPEKSSLADAEFVLEIHSVEFIDTWGIVEYPLQGEISVLLFENPPLELVRSSGKVEALDAHNHPILYHKKARIGMFERRNLPSQTLSEYESEEIFSSAFSELIEFLVDKIVEDW